jgi:hypothetical protein
MIQTITKVKTKSRTIVGWPQVLEDLQNDRDHLDRFIVIVKRKIAREEPWPGSKRRATKCPS